MVIHWLWCPPFMPPPIFSHVNSASLPLLNINHLPWCLRVRCLFHVFSALSSSKQLSFHHWHHAQIHHPWFSITHPPLTSLKSGFQIKYFTEVAFSDISIVLIENSMVSCQPSDLTPLQYLMQLSSPVFSSMPSSTFSIVSIISIACAPLPSYPSNANISDVLYGSLFFFLHTSLSAIVPTFEPNYYHINTTLKSTSSVQTSLLNLTSFWDFQLPTKYDPQNFLPSSPAHQF